MVHIQPFEMQLFFDKHVNHLHLALIVVIFYAFDKQILFCADYQKQN